MGSEQTRWTTLTVLLLPLLFLPVLLRFVVVWVRQIRITWAASGKSIHAGPRRP